MALTGIEPVVAAVVTVLKAGLPTALSALSAAFGDTVALGAPCDGMIGAGYDSKADAYWTYLVDPRLLPSYPAVIVRRKPQVDGEPDFGNEYKITYAIVVDVVVTDSDIATCTLRTERYVRAVREILAAENSLGDVGTCYCDGVGWGEPEATDPNSSEYLQDIPMGFRILTEESP
jgi:hypothetical protein